MAILKKNFVRWYNQHSMGSKMDVAWAAVKMAETAEGVQTQTTNSSSTKLLDELQELIVSGSIRDIQGFKRGIKIIEQLRAG
jgi:hypothetical protein